MKRRCVAVGDSRHGGVNQRRDGILAHPVMEQGKERVVEHQEATTSVAQRRRGKEIDQRLLATAKGSWRRCKPSRWESGIWVTPAVNVGTTGI